LSTNTVDKKNFKVY